MTIKTGYGSISHALIEAFEEIKKLRIEFISTIYLQHGTRRKLSKIANRMLMRDAYKLAESVDFDKLDAEQLKRLAWRFDKLADYSLRMSKMIKEINSNKSVDSDSEDL